MPDMLEEFARDAIEQLLKKLPVEKRLEGLTPEQLLQRLSLEERVQGLSAETLQQLLEKLEKLKGNGASGQRSSG
jgi:hypothetical protein